MSSNVSDDCVELATPYNSADPLLSDDSSAMSVVSRRSILLRVLFVAMFFLTDLCDLDSQQ